MNESKPDYGAMNSQELRQHLEGYDFVTPTGEPLAPFLDSLMGENLDPKTVASICETVVRSSLGGLEVIKSERSCQRFPLPPPPPP